jgi:adenylate kinase
VREVAYYLGDSVAGQDGRNDDTADVIRHRLQVFAETTSPLVTCYQNRGILLAVDAYQPPESVTADIEARLSRLFVIRQA